MLEIVLIPKTLGPLKSGAVGLSLFSLMANPRLSVLYVHSRLSYLLLFGHPSLKLKPTTNIYNAVSKYLECTNRFTSP